MALVTCTECANQVSDKATTCPKCGAPIAPQLASTPPATALKFRHPSSGQTVNIADSWAWTLLFGCIYFAYKQVWTHALFSFILALVTAGFSWLVYPFFARAALRSHYTAKGWIATQ